MRGVYWPPSPEPDIQGGVVVGVHRHPAGETSET